MDIKLLSEHDAYLILLNIYILLRYGIISLMIYGVIFIFRFLCRKNKLTYVQRKTWIISSVIIVILTLLVPYCFAIIYMIAEHK